MLKRIISLLMIWSPLYAMEEPTEKPLISVTECLAKWGDELHKCCFFDYCVDGRKGKTLNLEGCNLGSLEGIDREEWKEATTLFLGRNQIKEISPNILKHFPKLRDLYIGVNPISYISPEVIKNLPELECIDISRINITEENKKELMSACTRNVKFIIPYVSFEDRVQACNDWETLQRLQAERIATNKSWLEAQLKELEKDEEEANP